jgi:Ca2+-transporting ATPase
MSGAQVAVDLDVDVARGLSATEVGSRRAQFGENALAEPPRKPRWLLFVDQFRSGLVLILAGAAVLAALVGDLKDALIVSFVLVFNGVLGFIQEGKAEKAMEALKSMLVTRVRVRRDGVISDVDAPDLVPGDVVLLEAGDRVPADGRLLVEVNLSIDEAALTGESVPVEKVVDALAGDDLPLAERRNMAYMNTTVVRGRAELVVSSTGMATEMGRIAEMLGETETEPTPLQRQLDRLGKYLAMIAGVAVALVFALRLYQGDSLGDAALSAVALAVAAIPEGLPAVVTVTLAVGVHQMALRNAIVKRLASVETLGSTTVICSDKTGTLTRNEMTVRSLFYGDRAFDVTGEGYQAEGTIAATDDGAVPDLAGPLTGAVLASDADVRDGVAVGDPTETALLVAAQKAGIVLAELRERHPRIGEVPFDSAAKFMATFHREGDEVVVYVKGAPDVVLGRSTSRSDGHGGAAPLDSGAVAAIDEQNRALAGQGLRVLAVASRRLPASDDVLDADGTVTDPSRWIGELQLEVLAGILDPPRAEARDAIRLCRSAGIAVKMITGDHAVTAAAIATDLGIVGRAVTGAELDAMSDEELAGQIDGIGVVARVSPEHKVRVVRALKSNGHVVAMTGDGLNDAAALRAADIGVAMGITGTEVTKEAGDMVLADDNFATIVRAVEQGRTIFDNILKFVRFQLATSMGAISTMLLAGIFGLPVPFTAVQVLYVNLIADGPPAISLGLDPARRDVMRRAPRRQDEGVLTGERFSQIIVAALTMAIATTSVLAIMKGRVELDVALTMTFTTFVLFQVFNAFNARSGEGTIFSRELFSNGKLWAALVGVVAMQIAVVHWGPLQGIFDTVGLSLSEWAAALAVACTVVVVEELRKVVVRARRADAGVGLPDADAPVPVGSGAPSPAGVGAGTPAGSREEVRP